MKKSYWVIFILLWAFFPGCSTQKKVLEVQTSANTGEFVIAFGSCNKQFKKNTFWKDIPLRHPDVWVWGGDNIYCDTYDSLTLAKCYRKQKSQEEYREFIDRIPVIGVWDDHDYGKNDGGAEYPVKEASKHLFLQFMDAKPGDERYTHEGTYTSYDYKKNNLTIRIILLDTRTFRTELTRSGEPGKRYRPNPYGEGTLLGKAQWEWLERVMHAPEISYFVIVSSIQFLSGTHGFECWGNFPHERDRMIKMISDTAAGKALILSGDRHISEISVMPLENGKRLIDFTSSGLTHAYTAFEGEENNWRISPVIHRKSYGVVRLTSGEIVMEMWGENNSLLYRTSFRN